MRVAELRPSDRNPRMISASRFENLKRSLAQATIRPRTFVRYSEYVRIHAIPIVGHIVLSHLGPQHLQQLYANRLEAGLSPASVAHLHTVIHTALARAEAWGLYPGTSPDWSGRHARRDAR